MNKCPVCFVSLFGNPERCSECGTPIRKNFIEPSNWLNLILPGVTPLWKGHLIIGSIGVFGSCFVYGWLLNQGGIFAGWEVLQYVMLLWIPWAVGWIWFSPRFRRKFVSRGFVASFVIGLLILLNAVSSLAILVVVSRLLTV